MSAHRREHCRKIIAQEPYGPKILAQEDFSEPSSGQPLLRREDLCASLEALAPTASESYHRSVDQKALPEIMKCVSEESFDDFEAFLEALIPGARIYVHGHDGGGDAAAGDAAAAADPADDPALEELFAARGSLVEGANPYSRADVVGLQDVFVARPPPSEAENSVHEDGGDAPPADHDTENPIPIHAGAPPAPDAGDAPSDGYSARAGAPPAPDAGADPGEGIEMQELATTPKVKDWKKRVSIKYGRGMSIKGTSRTGAKVAEYEKEKGPGNYPYSAFVTDVLRASFLCDDDEAFHMCWKTLEGADPTFHVTRLKNKIAQNVSPFNYHVNGLFKSSPVPKPTVGPRRRRRDRSGRRRDHRAAAAARPLRGGGATAPRRRRDHSADTHVSL